LWGRGEEEDSPKTNALWSQILLEASERAVRHPSP
jgi:hypothetical protein